MLSPGALEEAARAARMWPWTERANRHEEPETLWHLPNDPLGVPLGHALMVATIASWLRSDVVAVGGPDAHLRYLEAAKRIEPRTVWVGAVFLSDDISICASMVALGRWTVDHARLAAGAIHEPQNAQETER